jgi:hypothetical protein
MTSQTDPIAERLAALRASTAAAAPRPLPFAVVRTLAARRLVEIRSRRLLRLLVVASTAPIPILAGAAILHPPGSGSLAIAAACLLGAAAGAAVAGARVLGLGSPTRA